MARINLKGLDELISALDTIQFDELAPKMLEAGSKDVVSAMRSTTAGHVKSGSMHGGVKAGKVKQRGDSYELFVYPSGSDPEGTSNMEKACYMEYGTSHQPATPIVEPAAAMSEGAAINHMREKFEQMIRDLEV